MKATDKPSNKTNETSRDKHTDVGASENNKANAADTGALTVENTTPKKNQKTFDFVIDGVDYFVRIESFSFNDDTRYFVSVNDGPNHLFVWDQQMNRIRSLNDEAGVLPDGLEVAISNELISGK